MSTESKSNVFIESLKDKVNGVYEIMQFLL